jgi:hypothetical protein
VVPDPTEAIEQRDLGLQRLRDLTRICFFWAAGLLALFSVVAAATIPGSTQNSTSASTNPVGLSVAPTRENDDDQRLQGPATGSFQPSAGRPVAVSGGSH